MTDHELRSSFPEQSLPRDGAVESGTEAPPRPLDALEDSSPSADRPRRLLAALVVLQVIAHLTAAIGLVPARFPGGPAIPLPTLGAAADAAAWIGALFAAGLLLFIIQVVVGLARRPRSVPPIVWMALGATATAQAILLLGAIVGAAQKAQAAIDPAAGSPSPPLDADRLSAVIGLIVFLLTLTAYASLRSRANSRAIPPGGRNGSRYGFVAVGVAATLIVLTGSLASATASASPVACADVTRQVGISFRGALGDSVLDGSDRSVLMQQNMGNGAAVGDVNGDGNLDLYLLGQPGHENRLYRNDQTATHEGFTDVTDAAGLGGFSGSRAAQFVDLNNDGRLDLVAVNDYVTAGLTPGTALQPSRIYENLGGGRFQDVTTGSGFDPVGLIVGGLGIADYNRDGLPDIYVTYWTGGMGMSETYAAHNLLFENLGNFRFKDVTEQVGLGRLSSGSFTPIFADLNGDGWPDLYIAVDGGPEALFINDHGTFRDATTSAGLGTVRNGMGATLVDPEGAGIPSIYVTNITDPQHKIGTAPGGDALLRARLRPGGATAYVDDAAAAGIRDAGWAWGAAFTDLNLEGFPDLYVAQGMHASTRGVSDALTNDRAHVFVGDGIGTFAESTNNGCDIPGDQRAVVAFDYNRDGAPDLLVTQVGGDVKLLENRSEPRGHWLTVVPELTAGHTVVGARVTVTAGGRRWQQTLYGGGGYLSGPPYEAYFGLGSVDRVTSVSVDWPDGTTTARSDVRADRLLLMPPP